MIIKRSFDHEKKAAVDMFREVLDTPFMLEFDFRCSGRTNEPIKIEYEIKRVALAEED